MVFRDNHTVENLNNIIPQLITVTKAQIDYIAHKWMKVHLTALGNASIMISGVYDGHHCPLGWASWKNLPGDFSLHHAALTPWTSWCRTLDPFKSPTSIWFSWAHHHKWWTSHKIWGKASYRLGHDGKQTMSDIRQYHILATHDTLMLPAFLLVVKQCSSFPTTEPVIIYLSIM